MGKSIPEKMLKAYFDVAETMKEDPTVEETEADFHRTSKVLYLVKAVSLGPKVPHVQAGVYDG